MAKSVSFKVDLRSGGKTVGSVRMDLGCAEVVVGRSHKCALCTPEEDHSVSGRHLRLYWRGKSLYAEDAGSRNGVYCRGARLAKAQKVASGDMFAIGNSIVVCESIEVREKSSAAAHHRLERMNGDDAGKQIEIVPKKGEEAFTIGLDPGCSLVLPDMLVSRRHAELVEREDGECWIRDLGSRNGTYVNGEVLRGKERLLKDNDTITIAYFDLRFLDKGVRHARFFLLLKLFAVAATLCVLGGLYVAWVSAGATVEDHIKAARAHASSTDFAAASASLGSARMSRNADRYRAQIDALDTQIDMWRKTWSGWQQAQQLLAGGRFKMAQKVLDPLTSGALDAWVWNGTTAIEEKRNAEFAAKALRWLYDAVDVLDRATDGQPNQQADAIKEKAVPFAKFMEESKKRFAAQPSLKRLEQEMSGVFKRMSVVQRGFERVDECIAKLDAANPDFAKLTEQLDGIVRDKSLHSSVRAYADRYKQPCAELAAAKTFIRNEFDDLNAMRFEAVRSRADGLKLPSIELCSRHPQLSDHRHKLEGHHADAQNYAENLGTMVNGLSAIGVVNGDCGKALTRVLDVQSWNKALTFSCFDEKPPATRRSEPSGIYDALLGVEFTFQSLRALPDNYNGWCLRMIEFSPHVVEARKAFEYIEVFVRYLEERPKWLRRGELGAFWKSCVDLMAKREELIKFLASYKGEERAELVTGFYHGWFSRQFDPVRRNDISARFKALQRKVSALCEQYAESSDPLKQIDIRGKILAVGLPGDSLIHSKWVQKFEGGSR